MKARLDLLEVDPADLADHKPWPADVGAMRGVGVVGRVDVGLTAEGLVVVVHIPSMRSGTLSRGPITGEE
jgi:hypothetical protein